AVEVGEGTGDDPDLLADVELEPGTGLLALPRRPALAHLLDAEDRLDLLAGQRRGLGPAPDEPRHAGGVAHDPPGVVVEVEADEEVAGEDLFRDDRLPAGLEFDDVFHWDDDLEDPLLHVHGAHPAGQVRLHLVLVAGVGVDDEPLPGAVVGAGLAGPGFLLGPLGAFRVLLVGLEQVGLGRELARLFHQDGARRVLGVDPLGGRHARVGPGLGEEGLLAQVAWLFGRIRHDSRQLLSKRLSTPFEKARSKPKMSRVMKITAMRTTIVDVTTSAFVGQATFFNSPRTSRMNSLAVARSR